MFELNDVDILSDEFMDTVEFKREVAPFID